MSSAMRSTCMISIVILGHLQVVIGGSSGSVQEDINRACTVYCYGPILDAVQSLNIYNDSKTFVDMPMKEDPEVITAAFATVNSADVTEVTQFLNQFFDSAGSDLMTVKK